MPVISILLEEMQTDKNANYLDQESIYLVDSQFFIVTVPAVVVTAAWLEYGASGAPNGKMASVGQGEAKQKLKAALSQTNNQYPKDNGGFNNAYLEFYVSKVAIRFVFFVVNMKYAL